jgi:rifampin ADP-ribosylating transferase
MDQRGHGGADRPLGGYDLATQAADVVAFMDSVGVQSAVLLGSSSGGYVAQAVALAAPTRVTGLVLVGAPRSLAGRPSFADDVEQLTDPVDPGWVRDSLTEVPDWYVDDRVRDGALVPARVWRDAFTGLITAPVPTEVGSIRARTLIIWGARDNLLPRTEQVALHDAIPDSTLVTYEGTGHLVLWEQPERIADDLCRFLGLRA